MIQFEFYCVTLVIMDTNCIGRFQSNYHTIAATTIPEIYVIKTFEYEEL